MLEKAVKVDKYHLDAYISLSQLLTQLNRRDEAISCLNEAETVFQGIDTSVVTMSTQNPEEQ